MKNFLFFLLFLFSYSVHGQSDRIDKQFLNVSLAEFSDSLDLLRQSKFDSDKNLSLIAKNFCAINANSVEKGNKVIDLAIVGVISNGLFLSGFDCFTKDQTSLIKSHLNNSLDPSDFRFFRLVSLYKLSYHKSFLKNHFGSISDLSGDIVETYNRRLSLSKEIIFRLNCLSTYTNFTEGDNMVDSLIGIVDTAYYTLKNLEGSTLGLTRLYGGIVQGPLSLSMRKDVVVRTLYLLDEEQDNKSPEFFDYDMYYFDFMINPKRKGSNLRIWYDNNIAIKKAIKELILNDDTIWKDHIILK